MRRVFFVFTLGMLLFACIPFPMNESVCVRYEPQSYSLICEVTAKYGYTPEDLEGLVLDTIAIRSAMDEDWDDVKTLKVVGFTKQVDFHVDNPVMTFNTLVDFVEFDAQKSTLLFGIVSRRLPWFRDVMVIPAKDRYLIHLHTRHIREMFGVYE